MISLHVRVREQGGGYALVEREYLAQGISPSYATVCRLSPEEALALHRSRIVQFWGDRLPEGQPATVGDILSLHEDRDGRLQVRLRLPEADGRKAVDIEVPGLESVLAAAASDPVKRENLLRNTGIGDATRLPEVPAA